MKQKLTMAVISGVILLLVGGCKRSNNGVIASGTFESDEVTVSAEMNGKLIQFNVDEGDKVSAGETVAKIDTVSLFLKRQQLEAAQKVAESKRPNIRQEIAVIDRQIETATQEEARLKRLVSSESAPQKQLDDISNALKLLKKQKLSISANLHSANRAINSEIASIEVQISQVDDQLKRATIISPISGTVLSTFAENSEFTAAGKPLLTIANLDTVELRAYITADQLNSIKLGQNVTIEADGDGKRGQRYTGKIGWISSTAEFTPKTVLTKDERANLVYAIKVKVANDGYLRIGMYGTVIEDLKR